MHVLILFSILVLLLLCRMMHKTMEGLTNSEIEAKFTANDADHTKFRTDITGLTGAVYNIRTDITGLTGDVYDLSKNTDFAYNLGAFNTYLLYPYLTPGCTTEDTDDVCKIDINKLRGATGPVGSKGDKGDTGERGYRGYRGYSGSCTIG